MKKLLTLLLLAAVIVVVYLFQKKTICTNRQAIVYKLNNKNYCLLVAKTTGQLTRGLMNYRKPVDFDGMLFILPTKDIQTFWNENTYMNLNLYWLDEEKIVGISFLPSIEVSKEVVYVSSPKPANKVIELIK